MRKAVTARGWLIVSLLLAVLACASSANAEEPSLADKETARALFAEGDEKYRAGDFEGALKAFVAADEVMRVPTTGLERGRTLAQLGRLLEAHEVLLRVVRTPTTDDEATAFTQARADAQQLSNELKGRIPTIRVEVTGMSAGETYELKVDGEEVPETLYGIARKVDPGAHEVVVTSDGYVTVREKVTLKDGDNSELSFTLRPESVATADVAAEDGGGTDVRFSTLSGIGVALAGAGLVVGAVAGGITLSRVSDLDGRCPVRENCPSDAQEDIDAANLSSHVSTAGFVIAGVGVAVAIIGLFVHFDGGEAEAEAAMQVQPWNGGEVAGVEMRF